MANNRIYLRCKGCGDTLFLGKTFLRGYYWDPYGGKPLEDRLNEFYDKHNYCMNPKSERTPYDEHLFPLPDGFDGCDGAFDIVYENNEGTGIEGPKDTVTVVRCKDCKHRIVNEHCGENDYFNLKAMCDLDTGDTFELGRNAENDEWFCADGERKDGEG